MSAIGPRSGCERSIGFLDLTLVTVSSLGTFSREIISSGFQRPYMIMGFFRLDTLTRNGQSMRQSDGRWLLVAKCISGNVGIQAGSYAALAGRI